MTTPVLFWDVDTQVDFIQPDGKLHVPGSESIVPNLARLTTYAHARGIPILASADVHTPDHAEISRTPDYRTTFPPHCMRGTPGQRKIPATGLHHPLVVDPDPQDPEPLRRRVLAHEGDFLIHKHHFDVFTNPNLPPILEALAPERVVLYGVALDICDRYAVEGILRHRPGVSLAVVTDATRAIDAAHGAKLLEEWRARGVRLATTAEIVGS